MIGGSAAPPAMIETFDRDYGVEVLHAWGMSEMSPLGTVNHPKAKHLALLAPGTARHSPQAGPALFGVEMKIVDDAGNDAAARRQGVRRPAGARPVDHLGLLQGRRRRRRCDDGGWFPTGDVATIDPDGYMQITDRSKDVIKSGGEWISSIDLENAAMAHPAVAEAAVIGVAHPKWEERPLLIVQRKPDVELDKEELLEFLGSRVAKWWLPDDVLFVEAIPHTATGKILKTRLREDFKDYRLPTA